MITSSEQQQTELPEEIISTTDCLFCFVYGSDFVLPYDTVCLICAALCLFSSLWIDVISIWDLMKSWNKPGLTQCDHIGCWVGFMKLVNPDSAFLSHLHEIPLCSEDQLKSEPALWHQKTRVKPIDSWLIHSSCFVIQNILKNKIYWSNWLLRSTHLLNHRVTIIHKQMCTCEMEALLSEHPQSLSSSGNGAVIWFCSLSAEFWESPWESQFPTLHCILF